MQSRFPVPKSAWGPGPWQTEPDETRWRDARTGLRCAVLRDAVTGALAGYVEIQDPSLCRDFADLNRDPDLRVSVHGDLTYSGLLFASEGQTSWWIGFDCHHATDEAPATAALWRCIGGPRRSPLDILVDALNRAGMFRPVYRDLSYVKDQTEQLAAQVAAYQDKHR